MNYTIEAFIILRNSNMFVVQLTMTYLVGRDGNITNVETHNWLWEDLSGSSTGSPWNSVSDVCVCVRARSELCVIMSLFCLPPSQPSQRRFCFYLLTVYINNKARLDSNPTLRMHVTQAIMS